MFKSVFNITKFTSNIVLKSKINISQPFILNSNKINYSFTSSSNPTQVALMQQVQGKVFQVLRSAAKCDQKKLNRNASFQQLGFDSLDAVQLVVAMQQYFGFDIPNEQAQKIQTVQAAINTFFRHLNSQVANKVVQNNSNNNVQEGKN